MKDEKPQAGVQSLEPYRSDDLEERKVRLAKPRHIHTRRTK